MPQDEIKLMFEIFGKIIPEKELNNYLALEDKMRQQELETRQDILLGL